MATGFWKKRRLPLVGSLLVAVAIVPYLLGRGMSLCNTGHDPSTVPRVVLTVPPDVLDLGDVGFEESLARALPITNAGREPVTIRQFTKSCECTRIVPESLTIPPGETREVRLTLNLIPSSETELSMRERPVAVTAKPEIGLSPQISPPPSLSSGGSRARS